MVTKILELPPVMGTFQVAVTDKVQLGAVLEEIIEFTGPAKITVSTFSCGEEFLIKLAKLRKAGKVKNSILYCSEHGARKTASLIPMISKVYDQAFYINNHSKMMIVEGCRETVCVLASQNQTRGNRLENYTIINDGGSTARKIIAALQAMPSFKLVR